VVGSDTAGLRFGKTLAKNLRDACSPLEGSSKTTPLRAFTLYNEWTYAVPFEHSEKARSEATPR